MCCTASSNLASVVFSLSSLNACAYKGALVPCERRTYVYFDRVDFIDGGHITRRCEATPNNCFQPLLSWPFPFSATISGGVAVFAHVRLLLSSFPRPIITRPRDRWFTVEVVHHTTRALRSSRSIFHCLACVYVPSFGMSELILASHVTHDHFPGSLVIVSPGFH